MHGRGEGIEEVPENYKDDGAGGKSKIGGGSTMIDIGQRERKAVGYDVNEYFRGQLESGEGAEKRAARKRSKNSTGAPGNAAELGSSGKRSRRVHACPAPSVPYRITPAPSLSHATAQLLRRIVSRSVRTPHVRTANSAQRSRSRPYPRR